MKPLLHRMRRREFFETGQAGEPQRETAVSVHGFPPRPADRGVVPNHVCVAHAAVHVCVCHEHSLFWLGLRTRYRHARAPGCAADGYVETNFLASTQGPESSGLPGNTAHYLSVQFSARSVGKQ